MMLFQAAKASAICASHHGGDEREYRGHHALIGRFKRGTNRLNRDLRDRLEGFIAERRARHGKAL
jgi:hypothetical protein